MFPPHTFFFPSLSLSLLGRVVYGQSIHSSQASLGFPSSLTCLLISLPHLHHPTWLCRSKLPPSYTDWLALSIHLSTHLQPNSQGTLFLPEGHLQSTSSSAGISLSQDFDALCSGDRSVFTSLQMHVSMNTKPCLLCPFPPHSPLKIIVIYLCWLP